MQRWPSLDCTNFGVVCFIIFNRVSKVYFQDTLLYRFCNPSHDSHVGEPRAFVAFRCGGEAVLQKMIDNGAVIAYERNNIQMIRVPNNVWDNKTSGVLTKDIGGVTHGRISNSGLNELSAFFQESLGKFGVFEAATADGMDDMIPGFEILQAGDPRVRAAHAGGLTQLGNFPLPMDLGSTIGTLHFQMFYPFGSSADSVSQDTFKFGPVVIFN